MRKQERGQAAIFITLSIVPMLGIIGLAVDAGWAYWRKEACRTAADSAVLAAAVSVAGNSTFTCGSGGVVCQSETACPASPSAPPGSNVIAGCLYAKQNGFVNSGKQKVSIASGVSSSPVVGVNPSYWVSATVSEQIPQTFSAAIIQSGGTVTVTGALRW